MAESSLKEKENRDDKEGTQDEAMAVDEFSNSKADFQPLYIAPWPRQNLDDYIDVIDIYAKRARLGPSKKKIKDGPEVKEDQQGPKKDELPFGLSDIVALPPTSLIKKQMKCSLCSKVPTPNSLMCQSGHLICIPCAVSVPSCPFELEDEGAEVVGGVSREKVFGSNQCDKRFTTGRNQLYTHIYENTSFVCQNIGCGKLCPGSSFWRHFMRCKYVRIVKCQGRRDCKIREIPMDLYPHHLQQYHEIETIDCSRFSCRAKYTPNEVGMMIKKMVCFRKENFGLIFEERNDFIFVWIAHLENVADIQDTFCVQVNIIACNPSLEKSYYGLVYAYAERDDVLNNQQCIVIPKADVSHYTTGKSDKFFYLQVLLHAASISPELLHWKPMNRKWKKKQAIIAESVKDFDFVDDLKTRVQELETHSLLTKKEKYTKAFELFKRTFEHDWAKCFVKVAKTPNPEHYEVTMMELLSQYKISGPDFKKPEKKKSADKRRTSSV